MSKRKPEEAPGGLPEWMSTYGDLVTLLLCFFVLMFAMSNVDASKYAATAQSFNANFTVLAGGGGNGVNNMLGSGITSLPKLNQSVNNAKVVSKQDQEKQDKINKLASDFKTYFAENNVSTSSIQVEVGPDYVKLTFGDGILFDSGEAKLKATSLPVLAMIGDELNTNSNNSDIRIEGHTDNVPMHSALYPDNMYLSAARSISVLDYFKDKCNIDPTRLSQEGFGEYKPIASNDTPEGRAKNRRVEVKIMTSGSQTTTTDTSSSAVTETTGTVNSGMTNSPSQTPIPTLSPIPTSVSDATSTGNTSTSNTDNASIQTSSPTATSGK